jgi:formylglycine-generating enzyme required for sulfatase activity
VPVLIVNGELVVTYKSNQAEMIEVAKALLPMARQDQARAQTKARAEEKAHMNAFADSHKFIRLPGGTFRMGSSEWSNQVPVRTVRVTPFAIAAYETTFAQFNRFVYETRREMNVNFQRNNKQSKQPVNSVTWDDAVAYTQWLSAQTGRKFRLPTEAEWEYAARGGTDTAYPWGNRASCDRANYSRVDTPDASYMAAEWGIDPKALEGLEAQCKKGYSITDIYLEDVGSYPPNRFGLYDMIGNVDEWVLDCGNPDYRGAPADARARLSGDCTHRMTRGGSYTDQSDHVTVSYRRSDHSEVAMPWQGFRVVEEL